MHCELRRYLASGVLLASGVWHKHVWSRSFELSISFTVYGSVNSDVLLLLHVHLSRSISQTQFAECSGLALVTACSSRDENKAHLSLAAGLQ